MFSQRKSFFRGKLFYVALLVLFAVGVWLNQPPADMGSPENVKADTGYPSTTGSAAGPGDTGYNIMDGIIGKDSMTTPGISDPEPAPDGAESTETASKGYYLVKEVDGVIKIFYYDEEGKESLIKDTDIAFSLLSVTDQAFFQKGVIRHTMEELNELLQDFES